MTQKIKYENINHQKRGMNNMSTAIDILLDSPQYAEWVQLNALDYGITVCNGDTLIEAMESDTMALAYLDYIKYDGE